MIKVYEAERELGLEDQINSSKSVLCYAKAKHDTSDVSIEEAVKKAIAEKNYSVDMDGLYPTTSILVSTVWNLNDDVFDRMETWAAKTTCDDKPDNLNHDEKIIVGHTCSSMCIDDSGNMIDYNTSVDELPEVYHIVNKSVIYTQFSDPEMKSITSNLINEIEAGTKYVSMECAFSGFDYAIKKPDGEMMTLERNANTAFLTKYLRAYGGVGNYEGYSVGRLLRGIKFTAKGYVDTPANPASIIFNQDECCSFKSSAFLKDLSNIVGVSIQQKPNNGDKDNMSQELEAKLAEANAKVLALESELDALKTEATELKSKVETIGAESAKNDALAKTLNEQVSTLTAENIQYKTAQIKANRVNTLVAGGLNSEDANTKADVFTSLTDEQFTVIANELISAQKAVTAAAVKPEPVVTEPVVTEPVVTEPVKAATTLPAVEPEPVFNPANDVATAGVREAFEKMLSATKKNKNTKPKTESK